MKNSSKALLGDFDLPSKLESSHVSHPTPFKTNKHSIRLHCRTFYEGVIQRAFCSLIWLDHSQNNKQQYVQQVHLIQSQRLHTSLIDKSNQLKVNAFIDKCWSKLCPSSSSFSCPSSSCIIKSKKWPKSSRLGASCQKYLKKRKWLLRFNLQNALTTTARNQLKFTIFGNDYISGRD